MPKKGKETGQLAELIHMTLEWRGIVGSRTAALGHCARATANCGRA